MALTNTPASSPSHPATALAPATGASQSVRCNEGLGGTISRSNSLRMTCIADRQHFPLMTIRFVPVDDAAAVLRVNSEVDRPMNVATVRYSGRPDSLKDDIEVVLAHSKTV